jgi:hypothetical protein
MATPQQNDAPGMGGKDPVLHLEEQDTKGDVEKVEKVDQFGARSKTDEKEIALVRKLDLYMLVGVCLAIPLTRHQLS